MPYEEHLHEIHCPAALAEELKDIWMNCDEQSPFSVIRDVIKDLDSSNYDLAGASYENAGGECVLIDTLYRHLVLFMKPGDLDTSSELSLTYGETPVWKTILQYIGEDSHHSCRRQFTKDQQLWSICEGSHTTMIR